MVVYINVIVFYHIADVNIKKHYRMCVLPYLICFKQTN